MRKKAMEIDALKQKWYQFLSGEDRELIGKLVSAQMNQGNMLRLVPDSDKFRQDLSRFFQTKIAA